MWEQSALVLPVLGSAHRDVGTYDFWFLDTSPARPEALWTKQKVFFYFFCISRCTDVHTHIRLYFSPGRRWGPCPPLPSSVVEDRPKAGTFLSWKATYVIFGLSADQNLLIMCGCLSNLSRRGGGCREPGARYSGKSHKSCECQNQTSSAGPAMMIIVEYWWLHSCCHAFYLNDEALHGLLVTRVARFQ